MGGGDTPIEEKWETESQVYSGGVSLVGRGHR